MSYSLKKSMNLHLTIFESPSCENSLKLWSSGSEEDVKNVKKFITTVTILIRKLAWEHGTGKAVK